jgi:hypothetical protein
MTNSENLPDEKSPVPDLSEVEHFFEQNQFPHSEAKKFFTHYQSSGWKTADQMKIICQICQYSIHPQGVLF